MNLALKEQMYDDEAGILFGKNQKTLRPEEQDLLDFMMRCIFLEEAADEVRRFRVEITCIADPPDDEEDRQTAGSYLVEVNKAIAEDELAAGVALDIINRRVPIRDLEAFQFRVFLVEEEEREIEPVCADETEERAPAAAGRRCWRIS